MVPENKLDIRDDIEYIGKGGGDWSSVRQDSEVGGDV